MTKRRNADGETAAMRKLFQQSGLRPTRIRLVIFQLLARAAAPLTHADIMRQLPKLRGNRVTIYRALDALVAHTLVHRVAFADRVQRFAAGALHAPTAPGKTGPATADSGDLKSHAHFICNRCATTLCVNGPAQFIRQLRGWLPKPYLLTGLDILLYGLCPDCRKVG